MVSINRSKVLPQPAEISKPYLYSYHLNLLDFDHCVPWTKSHQYSNVKAWIEQPQVVIMTVEKKSGCFYLKTSHFRVTNME